jgi:hypothetical protein
MKKLFAFIFAVGAAASYAYAADPECIAACAEERVDCLQRLPGGSGACQRAYEICVYDCNNP